MIHDTGGTIVLGWQGVTPPSTTPPPPTGGNGVLLNGWALYDTVGTFTFTWQSSAVMLEIWGGGGAGGGSAWQQFGGAGGSGAWGWFKVPRPSSGISTVVIGSGGTPAPAGQAIKGGEPADTSFDGYIAYGLANGGTAAGGPYTGGEGGTPGDIRLADGVDPTTMVIKTYGGMGQPAAPLGSNGLNGSLPMGADCPRGGGRGSGNQQDGLWPGGGGAPGNVSFPSGAGGHGRILVYW